MNTGIISTRYAKALLKYTEENGSGERVCAQVREILKNPDDMPSKLEPDLERFVSLVARNGRMEDVRFILRSFVGMYYRSRGIRIASLVTSVPAPDLEEKLHRMLEKNFGCKIVFESSVDPSLFGGFVVVVDDYMLDASVRSQIETIRRQFITQNNRIV